MVKKIDYKKKNYFMYIYIIIKKIVIYINVLLKGKYYDYFLYLFFVLCFVFCFMFFFFFFFFFFF